MQAQGARIARRRRLKAAGEPFPLSIGLTQVGDIPKQGNDVETAIEKYTGTKLQIQWIPGSAYDDKINVMIASSESPMLVKVRYVPTIMNAIKSDYFWEIGPYLKDYKNLSAQNPQFYENISVDGKIYGVPLFRDLGRSVIHYRKDWFDAAGLKSPKTLDEWYEVIKALTLNDPDKNGKNDTYGIVLDKRYNQDADSMLTRFSVMTGGPNKWAVDAGGNFTPEFTTQPFNDVLKLFRRLYQEKLINQDFAVLDTAEVDKMYESGRAGIRFSGGSAQTFYDKLVKNVPNAVVDAAPVEGPSGRRLPGESGNNGFLAISKASVKTEADLRKVLTFLDKLMDPPMATPLLRGIEGKHYTDKGEFTEPLDRDANQREVKPYRDNLPQREGYNVKPSNEPPLMKKNQQIGRENEKYIVTNPALVLSSATYTDRGKELDQIITDAETKYIMGKIDDAGWQAELERWRKAGGDKLIQEYKAAYEKSKKK
ncbi:extracellular solute-binding protein [Paenibacillus sp. P26]|nr:extracellular solute-binding protein [Paenibacillus sp. P26]